MEPLVFKIETQADDSGVRKYEKSLGGLDVSSKKAAGALKNFSRDLLNAKSGADVAAAGAESLSRVLEKSLAGVVVIGGIKIVTDQINKMAETLRAVGESSKSAVTQLERMGDIKGIDDAIKQVGVVNQNLDTITQKLGSIQEGNWFTKLADSLTGTSKELKEQQQTFERVRDSIIAYGFAVEQDNAQRMSQLNDEQKQYEAIQQKLRKNLDIINQVKDANARASAEQSANALAGIETQNLTIKLIEEQTKKENEQNEKRQKAIDDQIKKEKELGETQQKRFNELYDAEIKSQKAMQDRMDVARGQELQQNLTQAEQSQKQNTAKQATAYAREKTGGSGSTGGRPTSFELGLEKGIQEAFKKGRRDAANAEIERTVDQIKKERAAAGDTRFTDTNDAMSRLKDEAKKTAYNQGRASYGTEQMAKSVSDAKSKLYDFSNETKSSSKSTETFSTNLSDLNTGFDDAMKSADNFSSGMTENSGNMIEDFLDTGKSSSDLASEFDKASEAVDDFTKTTSASGERGGGGGAAGGKRGEKGLGDIWELLNKNLTEMRTYALVK